MGVVLTFSEDPRTSLEALGLGREIADKAGLTLAILTLKGKAEELIDRGADIVYLLKKDREDLMIEDLATWTLAKITSELDARVIVIGGTKRGKHVAAKLAAKLGAGCISDCTYVDVSNDGTITAKRMVYSGKFVATEKFVKFPQILAIAPRAFKVPERIGGRKGEVREIKVEVEEARAKVVKREVKEIVGPKLEEAEIIVGVGLGIESKENIEMARQLADLLGGAVGGSRPVVEDKKWLPGKWVGLSGVRVRPKLYLACGISGKIQHLAGIRDSRLIVAINIDENAPIFEHCDYGIVGDCKEVIPALIEVVKKVKG